jgi:diadenosine tetraphosphate (Ap4A) HIT family hydrolase
LNTCHSCDSNLGIKRISPGETIFEGEYWIVEHAFPSGLLGWIVIVLKRHCEELHNLKKEEWVELADIEYKLTKALNEEFVISKEYIACFAEMAGFKHIHFHIIPKTSKFNEEYIGANSFQYLKANKDEIVTDDDVIELCNKLKNRMMAYE